MSLIKEPGQDMGEFGSQVIDKTRLIVGSESATRKNTSIVAQCFIKFDVLDFKLKALQFYNIVDDDPTGMDWDNIFWITNNKYRSLKSYNLWSPKDTNSKANSNNISVLHAKVNKLTTQFVAQDTGGSGSKWWTCGGERQRNNLTEIYSTWIWIEWDQNSGKSVLDIPRPMSSLYHRWQGSKQHH